MSNRVRFAVWALMLAADVGVGKLLDAALRVSCSWPLCLAAGAALLLVVMRAAAVTGRYLAVYGRTGGFGELGRLVEEGPYSCMRHPMHLFLSLTPVAVGLLAGSPCGAFLVGPVEAALILVMAVKVDEAESLERFGERYEEYRRRVPAFNLSPGCLKLALGRRPPKRAEGA